MLLIKEQVIGLLKSAGVQNLVELSSPPKPELGDLTFACFDLAKEQKNSPVEAAQNLQTKLAQMDLENWGVSKVMATGPYVNLFLSSGMIAKVSLSAIKRLKQKYGTNKNGARKKVIVEYPSNNTHKELHVGHLRNICIGNTLVQLFSANGYQVVPINYLNDLGAHVAKCLWGIQKFHAGEVPPKGGEQKWLGQIYAEAARYLEEHPDEKPAVYDVQTKLEAHDKSIWPLYQKTRQWSIKKFEEMFRELELFHRHVFYEQDVKEAGQKVVDELIAKKIATVGEGGAIIVDLTQYGLDIGLLRKSNGSGLYLTSDLALAVAKNKKYPDIFESVHLVGSEQNFYFKQLFKILELAGYSYRMKHIGYGLVSLASGKMSSRTGNVVLYEDVRDEVYKKIYDETKERHADWSNKTVAMTALKLTLAAIKFEFLKHEAEKTMMFDAKAATSFDGFTGPYVLYAVARINSLVRKSKLKSIDLTSCDLLVEQEEKNLIMLLGQFDEVIIKAMANYNPSTIVKYAFDLAKGFNDFYNKHSVLSADNAGLITARVSLSMATKQVLENALHLLTIDTVAEM